VLSGLDLQLKYCLRIAESTHCMPSSAGSNTAGETYTLKGLSNQTTFSTIESGVAVLLNQNVSDKKILLQDHGWHSMFSTIALKDYLLKPGVMQAGGQQGLVPCILLSQHTLL
jgi:hypothetical protein